MTTNLGNDPPKNPTVFITGSTGLMGTETVKSFLKEAPNIKLKLLIRNKKKNQKKISEYKKHKNIEIILGDLKDYNSVLKGVTNSDYVLHIGGMVEPKCLPYPDETLKVNVGGAENICKAVLAQKNKNEIKVCYIGSVAETGCRIFPINWGRCGDPLKASIYDHYALSKILAEKIFVESGIKNWVVVRMSGILTESFFTQMNPILFHIVANGNLEWCTKEDAGRLMMKLVVEDLNGNLKNGKGKHNFWNHFYNVSSGENYRLSNYEFINKLMDCLNLPGMDKIYQPNWLISKNFHGHFYLDSDDLEEFLHFRLNIDCDKYFFNFTQNSIFIAKIPYYFHMPKFISAFFAKMLFKFIANTKKEGILDWIKSNNEKMISAYFGSMEEYKKIPNKWEDFKVLKFEKKNIEGEKYALDHGYDDKKSENEIDINDCKKAAIFRGGKCLSENMIKGDLSTKLKWKCGYCQNEFLASPNLILLGGHWCDKCYYPIEKWDYDNIAKTNPFFAQVWYNNHKKDENNVYYFDDLYEIYNSKKGEEIKDSDMDKNVLFCLVGILVILISILLWHFY